MARREAPAFLERERGTQEQWLRHLARHPLAFAGGKKSDHGVPGAAKNTGDDACLARTCRQWTLTRADCADKTGRIACRKPWPSKAGTLSNFTDVTSKGGGNAGHI